MLKESSSPERGGRSDPSGGVLGGVVAPHVALQAVALREGLVAVRALVGSLPVVGAHVDRQVLLPRARLPAHAAREALDAQVAPDVAVQRALELEEAAAVLAVVRRLAGVDPEVLLERLVGQEAAAAHGADERPLAAVRLHVRHQAAAGQEGLAAHVAEERPVPDRVGLLVGLEGSREFEALPADLAAEAALSGVRHLVSGQRAAVVDQLVADVAVVLVLAGVRLLVRGELRLQSEGLGAHVALVGLVRHVDPAVDAQGGQVDEGFAAVAAPEGPVAGVQGGVVVEAGERQEGLPAVRAGVGLLVRLQVSFQPLRGLTLLSADATNARRLVGVGPGVFDQAAQDAVPNPAHPAGGSAAARLP